MKFKFVYILVILATCTLSFDSCRQHKEERRSHTARPTLSTPTTGSSPSVKALPPQTSNGEKLNSANYPEDPNENERVKKMTAIKARKSEELRRELFSIPLSEKATKDREEAWEMLDVKEYGEYLNSRQCKYACAMLDKYASAETLERLVFWRLMTYRISSSSPTGVSMALDGSSLLLQDANKKLKESLYSALGENIDAVSYGDAKNRAMQIFKSAAKNELAPQTPRNS